MPVYLGILTLGEENWPDVNPMMTIGLKVNCSVKDMSYVKVYVNREILLLFDREGIEVY